MMPKYIVGCEKGHDREITMTFTEFDVFKQHLDDTRCWTRIRGQSLREGGEMCVRPVYIKPQVVQFTIQAGLYDDFSTGSEQEKQLRREGYL